MLIRNEAIVDIRFHPHCSVTPLAMSHNSIYFLNLSSINAKLTSLSYVHASKPVVYLYLSQPSPLP